MNDNTRGLSICGDELCLPCGSVDENGILNLGVDILDIEVSTDE